MTIDDCPALYLEQAPCTLCRDEPEGCIWTQPERTMPVKMAQMMADRKMKEELNGNTRKP